MPIVRVDLHQHLTDTDWELRDVDVVEIVERARDKLGANGVMGVVDFSDLNREQKFEILIDRIGKSGYRINQSSDDSVYLPDRQLFLTRLQESETQQGHILTLGLPVGTYVDNSRELPLENAVEQSWEKGKGAIADHPFGHRGIGRSLERENSNLVKYGKIVGFEVFNGMAVWFPKTSFFPNWRAARSYQQHLGSNGSLLMGALIGTDGHSVGSIGDCYTNLEMPEPEEMLETGVSSALQDAIIRNKKCDGRKKLAARKAYAHAAAVTWNNLRHR